jgi:hypothetical protein
LLDRHAISMRASRIRLTAACSALLAIAASGQTQETEKVPASLSLDSLQLGLRNDPQYLHTTNDEDVSRAQESEQVRTGAGP